LAFLCAGAPLPAWGAQPVTVHLAPPVSPACISSPFGLRVLSVPLEGHDHPGVDLPAPIGATIRAAAAGQVVAVRRRGLGGLSISLRHADGTLTYYAHLGTLTPAFAEGKRYAAAGEALGRVGRTGMSFGPHIYFAVRSGGTWVDPAPLLNVPRCR
jgi:murein DD-endopeptidase MepM/ murein hydrolase activator NlpD